MSDQTLTRQATRLGLQVNWMDAQGHRRRVSVDTLRRLVPLLESKAGSGTPSLLVTETGASTSIPINGTKNTDAAPAFAVALEDGRRIEGRLRRARNGKFHLPRIIDAGYHTLTVANREFTLAVAPRQAPPIVGRGWGLAVQVYSLRSQGDGGIGHLGAVADLAKRTGTAEADALLLSPTHAMFASNPAQYSPYSPSSRQFFNVLLADPSCTFDTATLQAARKHARLNLEELHQLETASLIDWPRAGHLRLKLLRALYDLHIAPAPPADFTEFIHTGGIELQRHAIFETLHTQSTQRGPRGGDWRLWPLSVRNPTSPETAHFAHEMMREIDFHRFLQWIASRSLLAAQDNAHKSGMRIGLIADLAVGVDPAGSECWAHQGEHLTEISIGAPPDALSRAGQNWGLTTFSPHGLHANGYQGFIAMLRANLAHVGGLRIDHVMGLRRLWIIPKGEGPEEGAYLTYPSADLMRLATLEASRANAVLIGEALGTVEPAFRKDMIRHGLTGMNVLPFQRDSEGAFLPCRQWSRTAVAMTTTHDLPPLARWWQGLDLATTDVSSQIQRGAERTALWTAVAGRTVPEPPSSPTGAATFVDRAVSFVADTPCPLAIVPLEDLAGLNEQPNVPGTTTSHPNWRQRYPVPARTLLARRGTKKRLTLLKTSRPRS
ncbi:4-alpha-glucanotransferase [Acetobacter estunensis]|uniref:4-alpha-glucanotransferase n=1 Tax=Acetobacter estunensis TaxID=104097 RepID=UPI001C2DE835|nr:4-alpha-glucanotransferase [Acetobacter estunensis]MBV1835799.1 4-alpha-glucanotransferase [Acetobacter estunensis]MBV1835940.1 4-alpha-glucanotransferase [Acetobacter estunensis]